MAFAGIEGELRRWGILRPKRTPGPDARDAALYAASSEESAFDTFFRKSTQKLVIANELGPRIARIPGHESLEALDIGSSKGTQLAMVFWTLARLGYTRKTHFALLEPEEKSVEALKQNMDHMASISGDVFTSTIQQTGWEEASIPNLKDLILCTHTIYHFPQLRNSLQKMVDTLKPGGRLIIVARERQGNQVMDLIQRYKKLSGDTFNEVTIQNALPHLEQIVRANPALSMSQDLLEAEAFLNFHSEPATAKRVLAFFLQRPTWSHVPDVVQRAIASEFGNRDTTLTQVDRVVEIAKKPV